MMSGSRWVTTPPWLSRSLGPFLYSSSVYFCHLFLTFFAYVRSFTVFVLNHAHLLIKLYLAVSNVLEKASSISHAIIFLYVFSPFKKTLSLQFSWVCLSLSPLPFTSLLSITICKASSDNHFAFLHLFFFGMILAIASCTVLWTSIHSSSSTLYTRSNSLNLFIISTVLS